MKQLTLSAAFMSAALCTSPAVAKDLFAGLTSDDCMSGTVENATARDTLLTEAKLPHAAFVAQLLESGQIGSAAVTAFNCGKAKTCSFRDTALTPRERTALETLYDSALRLDLYGDDLSVRLPKDFSVEIGAGDPKRSGADRAVALLNGNWTWLKITCSASAAADTSPTTHDPEETPKPKFVLGKSVDDIGKELGDRDFASLSVTIDRLKKTNTWDVQLYAGIDKPYFEPSGTVGFLPYVAFQYNNADDVDDLTFGGALRWTPTLHHIILLTGSWETDHRFKSSVWSSELRWRPLAVPEFCRARHKLDAHYMICGIDVLADYHRVSSIGDKTSLATQSNFSRVGFGANFAYGVRLSEKSGWIVGRMKYDLRQDLASSDTNVRLFTASLGFEPGKESHLKLSVDYTKGRDVSSLEDQDKIVWTVGVRF